MLVSSHERESSMPEEPDRSERTLRIADKAFDMKRRVAQHWGRLPLQGTPASFVVTNLDVLALSSLETLI